MIGVPVIIHRNEHYYGPSGYCTSSASPFMIFLFDIDFFLFLGCWIREAEENQNRYIAESLLSQYLWMWIAAATMVVLYTIMFLVMRGWLIVGDRGIRWNKMRRTTPRSEPQNNLTEEETRAKEIAHLMLL